MTLTAFFFFLTILIGTLMITYWATKQTKTTDQYYTAGGKLTGFQNGLAIAGDYMSAASFLGITGAIALYGFDGFFYSIGFLVSYLVLLLLIAEPMRQLGRFTVGDLIAARFPQRWTRALFTFSTMLINILYMVAQFVAAGALIKLLLGIPYSTSVIITGTLMTIYVVFGGMMATSWVQIVKTVLLMTGCLMLCLIVFSRFQWDFAQMIQTVAEATPFQEAYLQPGNMFTDPLDTLSLNLALVLGTAGLPHILIRFLTVRTVQMVRTSVVSATFTIGFFYLMTLILGFGAVAFVGWEQLMTVDATGNISAPLLALVVGGEFLMAFVSAIAFATILAVVSGLIISASSAFAHDFYRYVWKNSHASEKGQLLVARIAAAFVGGLAILLALWANQINVAVLVSLIFSIAASVHFPVLLLTLYWSRFTVQGMAGGMITGLVSSILLVLLGPFLAQDTGLFPNGPLFPLKNPGMISIPLSFFVAWAVSRMTNHTESEQRYQELTIRTHLDYSHRED